MKMEIWTGEDSRKGAQRMTQAGGPQKSENYFGGKTQAGGKVAGPRENAELTQHV